MQHTYIQTDRQTDKQRQTDRLTDRQTDRQTDRDKDRQTETFQDFNVLYRMFNFSTFSSFPIFNLSRFQHLHHFNFQHFNISICQNVGEAGNVETVGKLKVVKNVDMLTCLNLKC